MDPAKSIRKIYRVIQLPGTGELYVSHNPKGSPYEISLTCRVAVDPKGADIRPVYGPGKVRRSGRILSGYAGPVNRLDLPPGFWVTLPLHSERTSFNRGG
jgi:hypothetical protein